MNRFLVLSLLLFGCISKQKPADPENPFQEQKAVTELNHDLLEEASGLETSFRNPEHLWSHNDSGGEPEVYLLDEKGEVVFTVRLEGVRNIDWEEIVTMQADSTSYVFIADFGDNKAVREKVSILRFEEPAVNATGRIVIPRDQIEIMPFSYSEGPRDAESLMYDSSTGELVLVTKRENEALVYAFVFEPKDTFIDITSVGKIPERNITAADASESGNVLLRTYEDIYYFPATGRPVKDLILEWNPIGVKYTPEPQGEAICWDGESFLTLSEKKGKGAQQLFRFNPK